jgi:hypothetical protein
MHVYGLLMGKCTHARSLDEICTPSPQQNGGLIPRDSRHQKQVSGCRSNQFRHHFLKASQTSAGFSLSFTKSCSDFPSIRADQAPAMTVPR